ncbi:MAG: 50S ribosomal protein L6 [Parcubacteria group bacterium]|nr:50S ribosomal protein L6 [Parcubacteria group bacterium]
MSRIGKRPIAIPDQTNVTLRDGEVTVTGPRGTLTRQFRPEIAITVENGTVMLSPARTSRLAQALWGTYAAHIKNMLRGVTAPFEKRLVIEGIGYRAEVAGKTLKLNVGFSHPVVVPIPEGIAVTVEKTSIGISGSDKELVGQFAAHVRAVRKPEPYKGKGIRYEGEVIRRKEGKKAA